MTTALAYQERVAKPSTPSSAVTLPAPPSTPRLLKAFTVVLAILSLANPTSRLCAQSMTSSPQPPTANSGGPYSGVMGVSISFYGGGSTDPNGEALTYSWDFGDGGTSILPSPIHIYQVAGTYAVILTVTNSDGMISRSSTNAVISSASQLQSMPDADAASAKESGTPTNTRLAGAN